MKKCALIFLISILISVSCFGKGYEFYATHNSQPVPSTIYTHGEQISIYGVFYTYFTYFPPITSLLWTRNGLQIQPTLTGMTYTGSSSGGDFLFSEPGEYVGYEAWGSVRVVFTLIDVTQPPQCFGTQHMVLNQTTIADSNGTTTGVCDLNVEINEGDSAIIHLNSSFVYYLLGTPAIWYKNGVQIPEEEIHFLNYYAKSSGLYYVKFGEVVTPSVRVAVIPAGIPQPEVISEFSFYPNPATEEIKIKVPVIGEYLVAIYNSAGQVVWSNNYSEPETGINITALSKGIYFLNVIAGGETFSEKFVKE